MNVNFFQENPTTRTRTPLLATVSGPGGGKSFLIDEWLILKKLDINALEIELGKDPLFALFRQSLSSAIRLPVTLNDRMSLDDLRPPSLFEHFLRNIHFVFCDLLFTYCFQLRNSRPFFLCS